MVTTASAVSEYSNIGDRRQTMNTPAVTMVAAWISAETGVGPSMASGNQVCKPSCADLPMAPMNSRMQMVVIRGSSSPKKVKLFSAMAGTAWNTASKPTALKARKIPKMPSAKPKSPTRLTRNALMAAALALGLSYQKPIRR